MEPGFDESRGDIPTPNRVFVITLNLSLTTCKRFHLCPFSSFALIAPNYPDFFSGPKRQIKGRTIDVKKGVRPGYFGPASAGFPSVIASGLFSSCSRGRSPRPKGE